MDLEFSEEQEMLRDMVRGVCSSYSPLETVRAVEDDPVGYPLELWKQLGALDLIGLMVSPEYGGSGMSLLDGVVVYEELGRALAPSPHFVSAVMSAGVLERNGSAEQKADLLPQIVAGDAILTPAWIEPHHGFGPKGVQLAARADGDDFVLDGVKWHVPFAAAGDPARGARPDRKRRRGCRPVPGGPERRRRDAHPAADDRLGHPVPGGAGGRAGAGRRRGSVGASSGWAAWSETMYDGIVLLAAYAMGGARYAFEITLQYSKDRHQFDKPLGAFQAIAHYLADASTTVEGGTILVHEAAWNRANGRPIDSLAPMAKLFACQTFRDVTAMAQQVFGGVGFTNEYDIQLYFRRAKQLQISWWDDRYLEELIATATLD